MRLSAFGSIVVRPRLAALLAAALLSSCVSEKVPSGGAATFEFKPAGAAVAGSARQPPGAAAPPAAAVAPVDFRASQSFTNKNEVITLINPLIGRIASVNPALRFVVLDFSLNRLPAVDQQLRVYRQGQKVGEVKVSGPELNNNIVADLVAGEAQPGDEVRAN